MASLVLTTAGGALGGALGGPIGTAIGQFGGGLAGSALGLGGGGGASGASMPRITVGPRLTSLAGIASTEGAPMPRVYGRARTGGQMIWATRFLERVSTAFEPTTGGKGGDPAPATPQFSVKITYSYYASFAIALCEGPIAFVRRVWADGDELDLTTITLRVYTGTEDQEADPLIAAIETAGTVPTYRGTAYAVFEWLPIGPFGNRIPQFSFEVVRPVDGIGRAIRAVNMIPGGTEFGYTPFLHISIPGPGTTRAENRNQLFAETDWKGSLDVLQALCPNLESVALIYVWFGDDLRAGHCTIAPRVDNSFKTLTFPSILQTVDDWSVAGGGRSGARLTSFVNGAAAFGGTPSDASMVAAIRDLKARGLAVVFYPFVMMDIPPGNTLPDPWTGEAGQPAFPWRGRITCDPAPGRDGSPDGTGAAATQLGALFGPGGPYRAFINWGVALAQAAGGVSAFLIGSELVSLTRVRASPGVYPAVAALCAIAADVKAAFGAGTKVSYGADWTEYGAHVRDGGNEVRFPLDPLWSSAAIDSIGIDAYWPLSDWRDGEHLDSAIADSTYDLAYLRGNIVGGEAFDWYYADDAARAAQTRLPITDGACGKPWVFRAKDIASWWLNPHNERVGGVEIGQTAWSPGAKPIWLTEFGCPAVDRGANSPNLFPDPKSSESGLPPFSRGFRDDLIQARFVEAVLTHYDPTDPNFVPANNPVGPHGFRMVDPARLFLWCWDARPFPAFPALSTLWADSDDWHTGHWLNGRLEGMPLDRLLAALSQETRLPPSACVRPDVDGFLDGYVLDRPMSMRAAIDPLTDLFSFDAAVSSGVVRFVSRARHPVATLTTDDLVAAKDGSLLRLTRRQETELPHEVSVSFCDADNNYAAASVLSRRVEGWSSRQAGADSAAILNRGTAQRLADTWLDDLWIARETAGFDLDPRRLALEPGDVVTLESNGAVRTLRVSEIADGATRSIAARAIDLASFDRAGVTVIPPPASAPRVFGPPFVVFLDLAVARNDPVTLQYIAATADPWPGALHVFRVVGGATNELVTTLVRRATIGTTLDALPPGPVARFDERFSLRVKLHSGALASLSDEQVLGGANTFAICGADGAWEIFAACRAELVDTSTYRLGRMLRGIGGEEALATRTVASGATVVLLDDAVTPLMSGPAALGATVRWRVGPANRDAADMSYVDLSSTVTHKALMPYAAVQPDAVRVADGIRISWTRRGRLDADPWDPIEIPLGEVGERYTVSVETPGSPRVFETSEPAALYPSAALATDFGAPPAALTVTVREISAVVGPGFPLVATVPVR